MRRKTILHNNLNAERSIRFAAILLAVIFGSVLATPAMSQAQETNLRWKFADGDAFALSIVQDMSVDTSMDRRKLNESKKVTMDFDWKVESVTDEVARIRQVLTRVQATVVMPAEKGAQTIEYDSNNEKHSTAGERRLDKSFSKVVNMPVFIFMNPQGEVVDVEIPEDTMAQMREMPGSMQGRMMFELPQLQSTFANAGTMLPKEPVKEGGTWQTKRDFAIGTPQKFNLTSDFTIEKQDGDMLSIKVKSTVAPIKDSSEKPAGDKIEYEDLEIVEQNSTGTINFDVAKGNCSNSSSTLTMQTQAKYRDMQLKVAIKNTSTLTVERK